MRDDQKVYKYLYFKYRILLFTRGHHCKYTDTLRGSWVKKTWYFCIFSFLYIFLHILFPITSSRLIFFLSSFSREKIFQKLLLNFTWWVNRKDQEGNNIFEGGFLGLDSISFSISPSSFHRSYFSLTLVLSPRLLHSPLPPRPIPRFFFCYLF